MTAGDWVAALPDLRRALSAATGGQPWTAPDDLDEQAFLAAAARHRVLEVLADSDLLLPDRVRGVLSERRHRTRMKALVHARELGRALDLLDAAGVRVLVVKGLALATQVTGDFSARGLGDHDLFVSPDDVARAHLALTAGGWCAERGFPEPGPSWAWRHLLATYCELPLAGERSALDLHWHLAPTRGVLPGFDGAWDRRVTVDVGGRAVATLGRDDAWLHSCEHAMKDDWRWLRSLVDVRRLSGTAVEHRTVSVTRALLGDDPQAARPRDLRIAERAQSSPPPGPDSTVFPGLGVPLAIAESVRGNARPREVARVAYRFVVVPTAEVEHPSAWAAIPATLGWRARRYVARVTTWRRARRTTEAA